MIFKIPDSDPQIIMMGVLVCLIFLFIGIGFLLLVHFCVGGGPVRWSVNPGAMVHRSRSICYTVPAIDLEKLPCYNFKAAEGTDDNPVECAVCLDNLVTGDRCRLLPTCNHSFHTECIDLWLLKTPICPICRANAANYKQSCMVSGEGSSQPSEVAVVINEGQEIADETETETETQISSDPSPSDESPSEPPV